MTYTYYIMADFKRGNHRNLVPHLSRLYPHQKDYFELLKLQGRNISDFIRVAIDRSIEAETTKHL